MIQVKVTGLKSQTLPMTIASKFHTNKDGLITTDDAMSQVADNDFDIGGWMHDSIDVDATMRGWVRQISTMARIKSEEGKDFTVSAGLLLEYGGSMAALCHSVAFNSGWWGDSVETKRDSAGLLALMHSECSEMWRAARTLIDDGTLTYDDHLPTMQGTWAELADVQIRLSDMLGAIDFNWGIGADTRLTLTDAKYQYNSYEININDIHVRISNILEKLRKGQPCDQEIIAAQYEILRVATVRNIKLTTVVLAKLHYNMNRADHKVENRNKEGGKKL